MFWLRPAARQSGRRFAQYLGLASATLVPALALVSCHRSQPPVIAVIPRTTALMLWESEHAGAELAAKQTGFTIYWNAPTSEEDVQKQIAMVERAVAQGAQGLVLAPDQALALMVPVRNVVARGIPTVVISSPLPITPGGKLAYILNDEDETGRIAAQRIGAILHGKGSVAVLGIDPDITGIVVRTRAFEQYMAELFPDIRIVDERSGGFNIAEAQEVTDQVLRNHPGLNAVLALNSAATRGAYLALGNKKLLSRVKLVACEQELVPPLVTGEIDSIIVENTWEMGYRAIHLIDAERHGEKVPSEIKLSPKLVTRENLHNPEVQKMLTMDWRNSH